MKKTFLYIQLLSCSLAFSANAQDGNLFDSDSVLSISISGSIRELVKDRSDKPKYHPLTLSYVQEDGKTFSLAARAKTRGHFRRLMGACTYPPLMLYFTKGDSLNASIFSGQEKLKLVMPCRGDNYVVNEWLVYKLYNILTKKSFKARLTRAVMNDTRNSKATAPFYGILLEDEKKMAKRNGNMIIKRKTHPVNTDENDFLLMAVFQYMIGNTDWSVQYFQNIKLIADDSMGVPSPVAYDFDHAGIVGAPYAKPTEALQMSSTLERRFRGFCITDMKKFEPVIKLFNQHKDEIYSLYRNCTLLDTKYVKATLKYLDEFYQTINNPARLKNDFSYPCDPNGTGNVVIKGMKDE